jgi:hypothetical protein
MRALLRMALAVPMVLALAPSAGAVDPYIPIFNTERTYVHCGGADKATVGERVTYSWNTTAPTTSFTNNGGCGALDNDKLDGEGVVYTGKHTGNLKQLTVHAHVIDCCLVRGGVYPDIWMDASVEIDGNPVLSETELHIVPVDSSTGVSRLLEFSVTGIKLLTEADYKEHDVSITLETAELQDGDQIAWVLDASEVQTGVTFSPTTLSSNRVPADG